MNAQEAKEILIVFRPGTSDGNDPVFAEALQLCERDPELKRWFEEHCAVYATLRARLKEIPVPEGLKEQILAERKVQSATFSRRSVVLAAVAAVAVLTGLLSLLLQPREDISLPAFRSQMATTSFGMYGMEYETNDLSQIRAFFARKQSDAGYVVPSALEQNAKPTGCVGITWHGKPVTMICFHSGKQLAPGDKSDLFLFVTDNATVTGQKTSSPSVEKVNRGTTASWSQDGRTYLLVGDGDEEFLRKYL